MICTYTTGFGWVPREPHDGDSIIVECATVEIPCSINTAWLSNCRVHLPRNKTIRSVCSSGHVELSGIGPKSDIGRIT